MCSTIIKNENSVFICSSKNSYETLIFSGGNDKKIIIWEIGCQYKFFPKKFFNR